MVCKIEYAGSTPDMMVTLPDGRRAFIGAYHTDDGGLDEVRTRGRCRRLFYLMQRRVTDDTVVLVDDEAGGVMLCPWRHFVTANETSDLNFFQIRNELRRNGFYLGGGGAEATWSLALADADLSEPLLAAAEGVERERINEQTQHDDAFCAGVIHRADRIELLRWAVLSFPGSSKEQTNG